MSVDLNSSAHPPNLPNRSRGSECHRSSLSGYTSWFARGPAALLWATRSLIGRQLCALNTKQQHRKWFASSPRRFAELAHERSAVRVIQELRLYWMNEDDAWTHPDFAIHESWEQNQIRHTKLQELPTSSRWLPCFQCTGLHIVFNRLHRI